MYKAAVITVSDSCFNKKAEDLSGPTIISMLKDEGYDVCYSAIVPDEIEEIKKELLKIADTLNVQLCVTTGGGLDFLKEM